MRWHIKCWSTRSILVFKAIIVPIRDDGIWLKFQFEADRQGNVAGKPDGRAFMVTRVG